MRTLPRLTPVLIAGLVLLAVAASDPPPDTKAPPAKAPPAKDAPPKDASPKEKQPKEAPPAKAPSAAKEPAAKDGLSLQVGKNVPGPFHPYNVTGPHKGHFHCLVSEHGLDPMVMIFLRGLEFSEPLDKLLGKLDLAIDKNPNVRLAAFAVFLPGELSDVVGTSDKADDLRIELGKKVQARAEQLKLKHVALCLDNKADLEKYDLDDANTATVVLYNKYAIVDVFPLTKDKFTDAAVDRIMAAVGEKLGATRR
jgi:hypothetical protein